ncbi:hypothetical protein Lalb_Chr18g0053031 [Lupinus albus]|uniref:Uncharacterized protein n=1 Tax=Lupinus albus TaxID=3870 RepID=A0A6A4NL54_LUPAL|nr:hypothetical protein Lalb_Chr18g0053031 [Lupinus albus]
MVQEGGNGSPKSSLVTPYEEALDALSSLITKDFENEDYPCSWYQKEALHSGFYCAPA